MLTLFRDIEHELFESGSGLGRERLKNLEAVTNILRRDMKGWEPFDFTYMAQHNPEDTPVTTALAGASSNSTGSFSTHDHTQGDCSPSRCLSATHC